MAPAQTLTSSQDDGSRHAYATLDCLRGVAAFMVVLYHFASNVVAPHGFLAVDLFFAMSGFVIASAYERRLVNGLGLGGFFVIRARRLGPLLALGAAVSLACAFAVSGEQRQLPWLAALSVLLVPVDGAFLRAFPLNGSLWSLHVEVVVNLIYACLARVLSTPRLLALAGASLVALAAISWRQGAMSDGSSELDMLCGYLRALVAFPAGVVIWRWRARLPAWRIGPATILAAAALLISGVGVPARGPLAVAYDLAFLAFGAPMLVMLAARNEPSARMRPLFARVGSASYALYALHEPILQAARRFAATHGGVIAYVEIAAILIPGLLVLAWAADRFYDAPVRKWLAGSRPAGAAAPAQAST